MEEIRYLNAPIQLYEDFLSNTSECLQNIAAYALYVHSLKLEHGSQDEKNKAALKFYEIKSDVPDKLIKHGQELYDSMPTGSPMVGLKRSHWGEFLENDHSNFDKAVLLCYIALKSIICDRGYTKTVNNYMLARMDGKTHTINSIDELSNEVRFFATEYQLNKLKTALQRNWGLVYYAYYTRGFYYSFTMTIDNLALHVEKKRLSTWKKQNKYESDEARKKALAQILKQ